MNSLKWEVDFLSKTHQTETCWLWQAGLSEGYGKFWDGTKQQLAHRVSYEYLVGQIPDGFELDHLCRVTRCVNPDHLEPVPGTVNRNRTKEISTQCRNGHYYTVENTYYPPNGYRQCRECNRATEARRQIKRKAAFNG